MKITLEKVEKSIQRAADLPTLPSVATTLARMVHSPNVSAAEIGKLIAEDQALSARVLRVVNSAYYGFPSQINNVTHAIVILGFNKVRDVVLTASVLDSFKGKSGDIDFIAFWEHSMAVAIAADALAHTVRASCTEDAFVAGLLHDIGKLVMAAYFPDALGEAVKLAREKGILLKDAEKELMDFDHSTVGKHLATRWSYSEAMIEAIHRHHSPLAAKKHPELVCVVHVADVLARSLLAGSGGDDAIPVIDPVARKELKLNREVLDRTLGETVLGLRRGQVFFNLIRGEEEEEAS